VIEKDETDGACSAVTERERERREVFTEFWWGFLKEKGHLEELNIDGRIILR
jgi:hypothetical protein